MSPSRVVGKGSITPGHPPSHPLHWWEAFVQLQFLDLFLPVIHPTRGEGSQRLAKAHGGSGGEGENFVTHNRDTQYKIKTESIPS